MNPLRRLVSMAKRLSARQRVAGLVAAVALGVVAIVLVGGGGDSKPEPPPDACDLLPAGAVSGAIGTPPDRLVAIPRPPDPEGDRCNYEDRQNRALVFFIRVEESENPVQARQLVEGLGGAPVAGVGDVARFDQTANRSQLTAFAERRWIYMATVSAPVSQEAMASLARQAIARGTRPLRR